MPENLPEVVYTPDSDLRRPVVLLRGMWRDLLDSRQLAWRLFVRDTRAQYRQSLLGYVWVLVPPLVTTLIFVFLRSQKILSFGETGVPYAAYVLTGVLLWETFVAALNAPVKMVSTAAPMLSKLNFPREALLLSAGYQVLFNLGIRLSLLVGVFLWFRMPLPLTLLVAPLGILSLVAFGFVLGLLLVPLGLLYRDVESALGPVTRIWFFATPVIYPPPTSWPASLVAEANPVSPLLITTREMLTTGHLTHLPGFLVVLATALVMLLAGWILYRLAMPHLISRMSA